MTVKKSVRINPEIRTRIIESRWAKFKPLEGDNIYAKWCGDGVIYKGRIVTHCDDGNYLVDFFHYGSGIAEQGDIYQALSDIPRNELIDLHILREVEGLTQNS